MKIEEVPILPEPTASVKTSPKVARAIDEYLEQKGIARNQLDSDQLDCLVKHFKNKRGERILTIMYVVGTVFYVLAAIQLYMLLIEFSTGWVPETEVTIGSDGSKSVLPPDQKDVKTYTHGCFGIAMILAGLLYGAATSLGHILGRIVRTFLGKDKFEKFFDAFLPLVGSCPNAS